MKPFAFASLQLTYEKTNDRRVKIGRRGKLEQFYGNTHLHSREGLDYSSSERPQIVTDCRNKCKEANAHYRNTLRKCNDCQ